jgi:hypothetical protein
MKRTGGRGARIVFGLGLSLAVLGSALALTGCVGYVQGDGGGVVSEPDMFLFGGGDYDGGRARDFGRRGQASRGPSGRSGGAPAARSAAPAGRSGGGRR